MSDNKQNTDKELKDKSIEEIMEDTGVNRETATAIYEAEHGINMCDPVDIDTYIAELEKEMIK